MSLPLQPDLRPWPPLLRRIAAVAALALAVLVVGLVSPARRRPPELLLGGERRLEGVYAREACRLIAGATQRCWLAMYVVRPDDGVVGGLLDALAAAQARGVDVRVLLDHGRPRDGEVDDKHLAAQTWLRDHGIRVVLDELEITSHAKVLLVDGRTAVVGSHNWTRSALTGNREAAVRIDDPEQVRELEAWLRAVPNWE